MRKRHLLNRPKIQINFDYLFCNKGSHRNVNYFQRLPLGYFFMNTLYILILLTTNANGMASVSFVNTESEAQCKAKENMIKGIFKAGNLTIDQSGCIASNIRFSKYSHNPSSDSSRYFWLVDLSAQSEQLISMPDMGSCQHAEKNKEKSKKSVICAVTDQTQMR